MMKTIFNSTFSTTCRSLASVLLLTLSMPLFSAQAPQDAKAMAPHDLTGYWVSLVTEDWRFRMITGPRGDYQGITLTQAGQEVANSWDPAADKAAGLQCKAYGAGGLMRIPTRLHITWDNGNVLKIESDAGKQTRLLKFAEKQDQAGAGTLQGISNASWELERSGRFGPVINGSLAVTTTDMSEGYLRRNGVPYSDQATLTEHFELLQGGDGTEYLVVISVLEDPVYLAQPVLTSTNFKRQDGRKGWAPSNCQAD